MRNKNIKTEKHQPFKQEYRINFKFVLKCIIVLLSIMFMVMLIFFLLGY